MNKILQRWMTEKYLKILKILIVCLLFSFIIYKNCRYGIINYDDYRFIRAANGMIDEKGILFTIIYSFFNMDLGNEYRTYGLLRVFTIIWAIIFGTNEVAYGCLLGVVHCASSILIYFTAKKVFNGNLGEKRSILIAGIWLMNPFSTTQTMHHMLYILMPAYLFILLVWIDLTCKKYKWILEIICMFGIVFFGENMIIPLYFFLMYRIIESCKSKCLLGGGYWINGVLISLLLGGHYLHYRLFRYSSLIPERFSLAGMGLNIKEILNNLTFVIGANVKDVMKVWNKLNVGYVRENINIVHIILYTLVCLTVYLVLTYNCKTGQRISRKKMLAAITICVSSYLIYLFLQIRYGSHYFNSRYMMACVPAICIAVILLLSQINGKIWRYCEIALFCALGVSGLIHYTVLIDYVHDINEKVIESIKLGENADKKFVIWANAYPNNILDEGECTILRKPGIFTDSEQFMSVINGSTVASPFQMMGTIQGWMDTYSDMIPIWGYYKQVNGTYRLIGDKTYEQVDAKDIMVICTEDIYFYSNDRKIQLNAYYDMDVFEESSLAYGGIKILGDNAYYDKTGRHDNIDELIYNSNIVSINCGGESEGEVLVADQEFIEQFDDVVSYGYVQGVAYQYNRSGVKGFDSNRSGEFAYKFELEQKQKTIVCIEMEDIWSNEMSERVFDLNLITDSQNILIEDINLYSIGKKGVVRILIPLEETNNIEIKASFEKGDVPFCNVIRVLKNE